MKLIIVCTTMQTNLMQTNNHKLFDAWTNFLWTIPAAPILVRWDEFAVSGSANHLVHLGANVITRHLSRLMRPVYEVPLVHIMKLILVCTTMKSNGMLTNHCKLFDMQTNLLWTIPATPLSVWWNELHVWANVIMLHFSRPMTLLARFH